MDWPSRSQTIQVSRATPSTAGTKTPETLSASRAMGALVAAASSTRAMIRLRVVSLPTRRVMTVRAPLWFRVAAVTWSPGPLSTGRLSPVRAASLTALWPERTSPSTGTLSPGRMRTRSPGFTRSMGVATGCPVSSSTLATPGARSMRARMASVVRPLLTASTCLPTVMSVRIMAALSK